MRFYDLLHIFASLMLLAGISAKVISAMLGCSSVGFTMNTRAHITGDLQEDVAVRLNGMLPEGEVRHQGSASNLP